MKLICLDMHAILWGIRKYSTPGQEDMILRSEAFFSECRKNKVTMMIPSIVVGEFLTGIDSTQHSLVVNKLKEGFQICPYDYQASALFAKLWREKKYSGIIKNTQHDLQATRQELKADCMIVATAIAKKADVIYSHDNKLKNFAGDSIEVREIPSIPFQCDVDFDEA
ncbi:PIN domain-containing protein [Methylomonas sp. LL1]|uniref:type II toxin-antitoxin system VapC family toxin n=1 Tax=Methylomonas sp. LL1 TaxID=2785785 RepID=UPI0018C3EC2B|nr:PIN domain-containing protein [Methylomonas sp. LL1]QPK64005.1 PIN domain-containing protein [Methylomonas sp. LL1]